MIDNSDFRRHDHSFLGDTYVSNLYSVLGKHCVDSFLMKCFIPLCIYLKSAICIIYSLVNYANGISF